MNPVQFNEMYSGMRLWDNKEKKWAGVLRVYLWKEILERDPNRYFLTKIKIKGEMNHVR